MHLLCSGRRTSRCTGLLDDMDSTDLVLRHAPTESKFQTDACCNECMLDSLEMLECRTFTDDSDL